MSRSAGANETHDDDDAARDAGLPRLGSFNGRQLKKEIDSWQLQTARLTARLGTLSRVQLTQLTTLFCSQLGMLVPVGFAWYAYYLQDEGYVSPINNAAYHPANITGLDAMDENKLRSERWSPHYFLKSPAAAGSNSCFVVCAAGILIVNPVLNGVNNSDVATLMAFMMILLGMASYSFHRDGDVLDSWAHRADVTFMMMVVGAAPFFALNGLWQSWSGTAPVARDPVPLLTKAAAVTLSAYCLARQPEASIIFGGTENFILVTASTAVVLNNISMFIIVRRAAAAVAQEPFLRRLFGAFETEAARDERQRLPENVDWDSSTYKNNRNKRGHLQYAVRSTQHEGWPYRDALGWLGQTHRGPLRSYLYHETWAALGHALSRGLLGISTIVLAIRANDESDALRDKGWGDDNLTKQWYLDLDSTQDDVDANIETRKRYDYMHGYWHLLTAMFMMQQTLNIIVANSGKIEHLEIYAGFPETLAFMQAWAILLLVWLALHLDVNSEIYFALAVIIAVPGGLLSYWAIRKKWPTHDDSKERIERAGIKEIRYFLENLPKDIKEKLADSVSSPRFGCSTQGVPEMTPENYPVHKDCTHV